MNQFSSPLKVYSKCEITLNEQHIFEDTETKYKMSWGMTPQPVGWNLKE